MDLRRHATIDTIYMGEGDDTATQIEWYEAPSDAKTFEGETIFRSLDHWDGLPPIPPRPGMIPYKRGTYSKGETPAGYTGDGGHVCTPDGLGQASPMWVQGIPSPPPPPLNTDPDGVPDCCTANVTGAVFFTGAGQFTPATYYNPFAGLVSSAPILVTQPISPNTQYNFSTLGFIPNVIVAVFEFFPPNGPPLATPGVSSPFLGPFVTGTLAVYILQPSDATVGILEFPGKPFDSNLQLKWQLGTYIGWEVAPADTTAGFDVVQLATGSGTAVDSGLSSPTKQFFELALAFAVGPGGMGYPYSQGWADMNPNGVLGNYWILGMLKLLNGQQQVEMSTTQYNGGDWLAGVLTLTCHSGAARALATFAGQGLFAATSSDQLFAAGNFSGTGSFRPAGQMGGSAAAFLGTGTLSPAGVAAIPAAAAFSGTGTFSPASSGLISGAAAFSGTGAFSPASSGVISGAAAFSGTGTFSPASSGLISGAAAFSGTGTFAAAGAGLLRGAAAFSGTGTFAAAGQMVQTVTSSGTITIASGITQVLAQCFGGGGGGSGSHGSGLGAGGGGGGYGETLCTVTPGHGYTATVGAAGSGGELSGTNGGNSSFAGDTGSATGSGGGGATTSGAGSGGTGSGTVHYTGGNGAVAGATFGGGGGSSAGTGSNGNNGSTSGSGGAAPTGGAAGGAGASSGNGGNGVSPGGGAGGTAGTSTTNHGGNGGAGQIILTFS